MKAVIVADIHGSYSAWQEVLELLNREDVLIIAGDLLGDRFPSVSDQMYQPDLIAEEVKKLNQQIYIVKGNCDLGIYLKDLPDHQRFALFSKSIFLTHGDRSEFFAQNSYQKQPFDIYICGHSHRSNIEKNELYITINPGSAAQPRSEHRTVGLLDQDMVAIYDLDKKEIIEQLTLN